MKFKILENSTVVPKLGRNGPFQKPFAYSVKQLTRIFQLPQD